MTTRAERKAKGIYGNWNKEDLKRALQAVDDGMGINRAANEFRIPKTTLKRNIKQRGSVIKSIGRPHDLPKEVEVELVQHLLKLEKMFYGLTRKGVMKLAFEVAKRNNIKTRFNEEKGMAGKEWFEGFMRRHPQLTLRQPEPTSLARAAGFNKVVVYKFFDTLEHIVEEHKITASRIFNMDETSHTVVQRPEKIIAYKGKHQVGAITSCERGQNVTGVYAMSAAGFFIPPMLIYGRKRMKDSLAFGAPPGTLFRCQDKGWMNTDVFTDWMHHFISTVKPSTEEKVILILDGHSSHTQSLKAIELARIHGVIMLSLPAHCTHRLQPLDVAFFKPLNTYIGSAIATKLRVNPGKRLTVENIASLIGVAFPRAAVMETAMNGFRKTGLFPVDRYVFQDADFEAASVTDRPFQEPDPQETGENSNMSVNADFEAASVTHRPFQEPDPQETGENSNMSVNADFEAASVTEHPCQEPDAHKTGEKANRLTVEEISPLPSCSFSSTSRRMIKNKVSGVVLTSTPHKDSLKHSKKGTKGKKRRLFDTDKEPRLEKRRKKKILETPAEVQTQCVNCGETYDADWIQCNKCKLWSHEECADISDSLFYYCNRCILLKC